MISDKQKIVLEKYRKTGTTKFSRNDYQLIATLKEHCRYILENYEQAKELYLELTK